MRGRYSSPTARREAIAGWLLAGPWILGFIVFTAGAMIYSFAMSFTNYDLITTPRLVGLQNYIRMFTRDPMVPHSLKITTLYALGSVPLQLVGGLLIAVLLNQKIRGLSFFRTLYYLPSVLPQIATLFLWMLVFNPQYGLLNSFLRLFGVQGPGWLDSPEWALPSLIIMSLWNVGSGMLIYLAGLQGIPTELYEAATIDGANGLQTFLHITIPLLTPVVFFNLVMGLINALQAFNQAYIMTNGGPMRATYFFMLHLFYKGFQDFQMGYASALAWVLFVYIGILTAIVFRTSSGRVYYES